MNFYSLPTVTLLLSATLAYGGTRECETATITCPKTHENDHGTLEITGRASVKAQPDQIVIAATITSRDRRASRAFDDNQARMSAVLTTLAAAGLAKNKIATESLVVSPVRRENKVEQFVVTRRLRITQDDLEIVSPILDGLVDSGIEEIPSIQFVVKDIDDKYAEALRRAVTDCRTQAQAVADGLGARIIGIRSLKHEHGGVAERQTLFGEAGGAANQMIVPTEMSATVQVHALYEIEYAAK